MVRIQSVRHAVLQQPLPSVFNSRINGVPINVTLYHYSFSNIAQISGI